MSIKRTREDETLYDSKFFRIGEAPEPRHLQLSREVALRQLAFLPAQTVENAVQTWNRFHALPRSVLSNCPIERVIELLDFFAPIIPMDDHLTQHEHEKTRFKAALCLVQEGKRISHIIDGFKLTNARALVRLATRSAAIDGEDTSKHIKKYKISDQTGLKIVAEAATRQNPAGTFRYISNYGITNMQVIKEIAEVSGERQKPWYNAYLARSFAEEKTQDPLLNSFSQLRL